MDALATATCPFDFGCPKIAQRFSAGISIHSTIKSVEDDRIFLPSLAGLGLWLPSDPSLERLGYFHHRL
jgi:hypothetical protein